MRISPGSLESSIRLRPNHPTRWPFEVIVAFGMVCQLRNARKGFASIFLMDSPCPIDHEQAHHPSHYALDSQINSQDQPGCLRTDMTNM